MKLNYGQFIGFFFLFWLFLAVSYCGYICLYHKELIDVSNGGTKGFWYVLGGLLCICLYAFLALWGLFKILMMDFWEKEINLDKIKKQ